jgi:hypothetical protein
MVTEPKSRPVPRPLTVIDTIPVSEELHVTELAMSCFVLSEKVPVAVNCCTVPSGIETLPGVTAIETRKALVTVKDAVPETLPDVAEMVVVPAVSAFANPGTPFKLMLATAGLEDTQVTDEVMFWELPSVYVPVAVYCTVVFCATEAVAGVTAIETRLGGLTVREPIPVRPEALAVITTDPVP